jgi:hypothetical protein
VSDGGFEDTAGLVEAGRSAFYAPGKGDGVFQLAVCVACLAIIMALAVFVATVAQQL